MIGVAEEQVAGCLGGPSTGWVGGDAGEEYLAGGDVDEEQQVVAAKERCVDDGEVTRDGCLGAFSAPSPTAVENARHS